MRLQSLNPFDRIGPSCLRIDIAGVRIVVDSGLDPKTAGNESVPLHSELPDDSVDIVIVTHCHLDHIGSLPVLLRRQPRAIVLMSPSTHLLCARMLHNSCNVMARQRDELKLNELPLYTHSEVDRVSRQFRALPYEKPFQWFPEKGSDGVEITLHLAGHVAGAAAISIRGENQSLLVTGDVLFTPQLTIPGAQLPSGRYDIVVTETTRGAHRLPIPPTRLDEMERMIALINDTIDRGGSLLMPVFALGRMQEVFTILHRAQKRGSLRRDIPIYGAGLGIDLANYLDQMTREKHPVQFRTKILREIGVRPLPKELAKGKAPRKPGLFILSSGMLVERTPSYQAAATLLGSDRNRILFVGYCDPDTPGGKLVEAEPGSDFEFTTLERKVPIRASIDRLDLSGHANRDELRDYVLERQPRDVVLTHGDPEARAWFRDQFAIAPNAPEVHDPASKEMLEL